MCILNKNPTTIRRFFLHQRKTFETEKLIVETLNQDNFSTPAKTSEAKPEPKHP